MQKVNQVIFKQLDQKHCYEKVFTLRNYGYLLARKNETRLEGKDYITLAEEMQLKFPYWQERRMNLFVPVLAFEETKIPPS